MPKLKILKLASTTFLSLTFFGCSQVSKDKAVEKDNVVIEEKVTEAARKESRAKKADKLRTQAHGLIEKYCSDCHDEDISEGNLDILATINEKGFDGALIFENIITGKMPLKKKKKQPTVEERQVMLEWLAAREKESEVNKYRRLSRHEFVYSMNDLLGVDFDLRDKLPEDRGTYKYDTNHKIELTDSHLKNYFAIADEMLKYSFPTDGFPLEKSWDLKVKLPIFSGYARHTKKYKEGMLFGCMRSNNGKVYPYFYEGFKTPFKGRYRISVDAAKVGNFKEHIALTLYGGKYFFTDANDNPQRVLDIISLNGQELKTYSFEVYLNPGEELSVHAYAERTLHGHVGGGRVSNEGAYIKGIKVEGPLYDKVPAAYKSVFGDLTTSEEVKNDRRIVKVNSTSKEDLNTVLNRFSKRAFSKELTKEEIQPYTELAQETLDDSKNFVLATRTAIKAMLCSSRFLQVPINNGGASTRLARALWLSVPEKKINKKQLAAEIDSMLESPKSKRMIESLANQWLNLKAFDRITPSISIYPMYSDVVNHYLPEETKLFLRHAINENLPVNTFLDSDFTFLNQRLAEHYEIDGVYGQEMRLYKLPENSERGGLLTMASILKVTTDGHHTSPILRGAWISKNIVGVPVSPPPADVDVVEPDLSKAITLKEQMAAHRDNKSCNACHKDIDPYGFALEGFDPTGQKRTKYRVDAYHHKSTFQWRKKGFFKETLTVDASSDIHNEKFEDVKGLKEILKSKHRNIAYNFAKNFFEYFNGYKPTQEDHEALYKMVPAKAADSRLKDLIKKVIIYSVSGDKNES